MEVNGLPIVKLGEILPAPYKNGIYKHSDSYGSGTRILRITDFDNNGKLVNGDLRRLELTPTEAKNYRLQSQDIVVNRVNSLTHLGKSILWNEDCDVVVVYESNMMRIEPDKATILPEFLIRILQSHNARSHFRKVAKRAVAQCSISQQDVKSLKFPLPPVLEQKKIAQILSTWDQAITATERLLENSQQRKKGLMQQLLTGKKRLPGFEGEWEKVQLRKIGKCIRGVSYKPEDICSEAPNETVRLLRSTNIQKGSLNDKDLVILPNSSVKAEQLLRDGDLCICMANGSKKLVGKSAVFHASDLPYTIGAFCAVFRTMETADDRFTRFLFESSKYEQHISVTLAGSSINNLKGSDIESMWFRVPVDLAEQSAIADFLSLASIEIRLLIDSLNRLKQEKKALMQQLLTGKRRVNVDTEAA